jgi:diguanylate cyclase (GGDEF)-like protein/PAS domain S-box-containing protein
VLLLAKDVTLERNLRSALFESRQRYKDLVEISSDFAWEVGADGSFAFVSPRGALGYPAEAMVGRRAEDFLVEQVGVDTPSPFVTEHAVEGAEVWMRHADGGLACVLAAAAPLLGPSGEWRGARGVCRDVTHERTRDAALARASNRERLLTYVVRTIRDVVDPADMLAAAAEATARAVGARGCQVLRAMGGRDRLEVSAKFGKAGDTDFATAILAEHDHLDEVGRHRVLGTMSRYRATVNGALLLWRDLDQPEWNDDERLLCDAVATQIGIAIEQMANHERILMLSRTDALTGLFNRRAFFEELQRRFLRLSRDRRFAALIYCDLDNFKLVNDAHGHQRGDEALLAVRDLLIGSTRPVDLVARLGGDEFAVWLEGADMAIATARCASIIEAGRALETYSGSPDMPLHLSLGVAVHDPARPESMEELLARADKAMYRAKRDGKGAWALAPEAGG